MDWENTKAWIVTYQLLLEQIHDQRKGPAIIFSNAGSKVSGKVSGKAVCIRRTKLIESDRHASAWMDYLVAIAQGEELDAEWQ